MNRFTFVALGMAAVFSVILQADPLTCVAQPVDTPALRDNGVAERVSDVKVLCTGGTPTAAGQPLPEFYLTLFTPPGSSANFTSRVLGADVTEALLLMDEPTPGSQALCGSQTNPAQNYVGDAAGECTILGTGTGIGTYSGAPFPGSPNSGSGRPNAFAGRGGGSSITFSRIPFDPPGNGPARVMRLVNVRLNVSQLNNVRGGATAVNLVISTNTPSGNGIQVLIGNGTPTVGIAQTAMDFSVLDSDTFLQCQSQNYTSASTPAFQMTAPAGNAGAGPGGTQADQFALRFAERFNSAFRRRSAAIASSPYNTSPAPIPSNDLNNFQLADSESGFYADPTAASWNLLQSGISDPGGPPSTTNLGLATHGTRLFAQFYNLSDGARFFTAASPKLTQIANGSVTGHARATVSDATGTLSPAFSAVPVTFDPGGGALRYGNRLDSTGFIELTPSNGTSWMEWEVLSTDTTKTEEVVIPMIVAFAPSQNGALPNSATAVAHGHLGSISLSPTASVDAAIPRFTQDLGNLNKVMFLIQSCLVTSTITVNTNLGAASYVLLGNAGTERKGAGSSSAFSVPAETYGITFKPVAGYSLPGPIAPKPLTVGGTIDFTGTYVRSKFVPSATVGIFREGFLWILDADGNRAMTPQPDRVFAFGGLAGDIPIVGDWNGSGTTKAGIYRSSSSVFMLDYDGDMQFNPNIDKVYNLGITTVPGDRPVVGDWNGNGKTKVGLFHQGFLWILDTNGDGVFQGGIDSAFPFGGGPNDKPIVGDWNGDGQSDPGIFRDGYYWILDYNGDHLMANINQDGGDRAFPFGSPTGDVPLVGDWNGDGLSKPGVFREGFLWIFDNNGNYQMDGTGPGQDLVFPYGGGPGDKPVVGKW